jgi:alkylhydroperoxidase/carboxymuconolactone decarboxylase family protein YurZ
MKKGYGTMNEQQATAQESLQGLSQGDASKLGFLQDMIARSYTESGLDPQTFMLVRMAALATLDAAPASWMMNIAASGEAGLEPEKILGTLIAIAPVIGTARIVSAAGNILRASELAAAIAESGE